MIGKNKPKSTSHFLISRRCLRCDGATFGGPERANRIVDPISIRATLDDRTMSDNEAPAMSAPEPVAAPAPAPAAPVSAAPVFDNAKVDELKLQATDKVQELYKKGKDKLDQVKIVNRYDRARPTRSLA